VQTAIYAATIDPVAPGAFGVAEISPDLGTVRPLPARGPTRLVAAARVRERGDLSTAKDRSAFDFATAPAPRVYAVLDESGCGLGRRIECGVVTIDPAKTLLGPGDDYIPEDWAGRRMPYRAPIAVPGRPLALAVSPPPAAPPAPELTQYAGDAMRLFAPAGDIEAATTAVGAVASDDGKLYFLDLGRFKAATAFRTLRALSATVLAPVELDTDPSESAQRRVRLWIQKDDPLAAFVPDLATGSPDTGAAGSLVRKTPGWTRNADWTVTYQPALPDLGARAGEVGKDAGGNPWLALQVRYGTAPRLAEVVKLWHPALGVQAGDLVVLNAADVPVPPSPTPACVGTPPADLPEGASRQFEVGIGEVLPPSAEHPGGAVSLVRPTDAAFAQCFDALVATIPAGGVLPSAGGRLTATIRAGGFAVTSAVMGYVGRPTKDPAAENSWTWGLAYPAGGQHEDSLAGSCGDPTLGSLLDWDGLAAPPLATCAADCRATCEAALLARKARRAHNNFEDCATDAGWQETCLATFPEAVRATFPAAQGPVVSFRFGVQKDPRDPWPADPAAAEPRRGMALLVTTTGGETPGALPPTGSPYRATSAIAFDRSRVNPPSGYRFLVSYSGDLVLDASPHVTPTEAISVR
jgi:hypothetical protein